MCEFCIRLVFDITAHRGNHGLFFADITKEITNHIKFYEKGSKSSSKFKSNDQQRHFGIYFSASSCTNIQLRVAYLQTVYNCVVAYTTACSVLTNSIQPCSLFTNSIQLRVTSDNPVQRIYKQYRTAVWPFINSCKRETLSMFWLCDVALKSQLLKWNTTEHLPWRLAQQSCSTLTTDPQG